ncbi:Small-conductance mechanosensitive channel [Pseudoruegeria aquimaris]|uniref:Small-conductance mechanosensitive channel n=1 Tax=Pseudoruegeria aquimaris TaxID=393663 RepID=A0A1Y5TJD4_9RHOB|nr:mechanosensitive ion channel domain-containing protein [Pseudoruegeria aquimaris]SLN64965.1 Small-conductance mechanosensitive channel [Pseudoruegeria aquimaris]
MEDASGIDFAKLLSPDWLVQLGLNVVAAFAILIVTLWAAKWVKNRIVRLGGKRKELDPTLFAFLGNIARVAVMALGGIFILNRFGVETTSLVALIGAAGLAVGLALQGTLSNFAAGVMLILFRPFKTGDFIEVGGESGTVKEISIFTTELATPDNVQIIIPNAQVWGSPITNYSAHDTRRVDFAFGVSYGSDLKKAEAIIGDLIKADSRILADPEPFVKVGNLGDSSVDFTVRVWCNAADYWDIKFDLTRKVKDAFDAGGIEIPFPTRTMVQVSA